MNKKTFLWVYTFTQRCPLDLHTNSSKHAPTFLRDARLSWAQKPKAAGRPSGTHQLPWRAKTVPAVAERASVLHYHHCLLFPLPCSHPKFPTTNRLLPQSHSKDPCHAPSFKRLWLQIFLFKSQTLKQARMLEVMNTDIVIRREL